MRNVSFARPTALLALLFSVITPVTFADQFDHLTPRASGVSTALRAVAFGSGHYVAVGNGGTILTTQDSLTWSQQSPPTNNDLRGIAFGGGSFVAVGTGGTLWTSPDGASWTAQVSGTTNELRAVTYGGGNFVAVGAAGTILVSSNGTSWTSSFAGVTNTLNGIAYGLADVETASFKFVAVGDSGTILTSGNGLAWTFRSSGTLLGLNSVALGANPSGIDVAVGQSGVVVTSPDTVTWTVQFSGTTSNLNAVAVDPLGYYSGPVLRNGPLGTFGAAGDGGIFITSSDGGNNWVTQKTETTNDLRGVTFETGGFLAVGDMGTIQAGFIWVQQASGTAGTLFSVAWGNDRFAAVGGSGVVLTSSDGANWQPGDSGITGTISQVIFDGSRFVAVGNGGVVLISTNALDWSSKIVSGGSNLTSIAYGNGLYVATGPFVIPPGGAQTLTLVSSNGTDWVPGPIIATSPNGLTFGAGLFCTVGYGAIFTSPDGVHWSSQNPGFSFSLGGAAYANGMFLVAGQYIADSEAMMLTSPDGTNWTSHPSGTCPHLRVQATALTSARAASRSLAKTSETAFQLRQMALLGPAGVRPQSPNCRLLFTQSLLARENSLRSGRMV